MRNLIDNANLLDTRGGDYKINSTFETASGTTNVEIRKSKLTTTNIIAIIVGLVVVILLLIFSIEIISLNLKSPDNFRENKLTVCRLQREISRSVQ